MLKSHHMKFELKIGELDEAQVEAVVCFAWEDSWPVQTEAIDKELGGLLKKEVEKREFKAEAGKTLLVSALGKIPAEKVFLLGLGKKEELTPLKLRQLFAKLYKKIKEDGIISLAFERFHLEQGGTLTQIQAAVEGFLLGGYEFKKYKTQENKEKKEKEENKEREVTILVKSASELVSVRESVTRAEVYSQATIFARDLVNEPSSVTTPTYLADLAEKLAKKEKFSCKIFGKEELEKMGMGALLGVARGSDEPVKFIRIEYPTSLPLRKSSAGLRGTSRRVVLIGKGITFDTGGLSLKTHEGMETMKMDMAGAAAILGIFSVLEKLRPELHVIGLIPCTENMPSGKAIKPGDIVKTYNGKTVEVVDTDAEGRLILADALAYGMTLKPDLMIDLATLTGACIVALGEEIAGLFTQDERLKTNLLASSSEVGEKFWPMPLEKNYQELLKSEIADLKNVAGKKYGGAITAALFLQEFVNKTPWAHLDIAGPAWEEKGTELVPRGGSGFGVRTILNFLQNM